jgi:uncharacterized membrane protein YphA (DoxX/SURF4 family)
MYNKIFNLLIIGTRILLGFTFFTAGMGKLTSGDYFPITMFPISLAEVLAPYGLSLWGHFVAWSQVLIGLLLLSQRFATLGAIMCLPLIANIFVVTVSLKWQGTPYLNAFLLTLNLFLLATDYHKLKFLFLDDVSEFKQVILRRSNPQIDLLLFGGIALCLAAAALHDVSRWLTFGLSGIGILFFLVCGVWQYFLDGQTRQKMKIIRQN